jgi:hypothetical protein
MFPTYLPPPTVMEHALSSATCAAGHVPERLLIADMRERNTKPRLWALDLSDPQRPKVVLQTWVEHGIGSDPKRTGFASVFGNKTDSKMTSLGLYAVGERYNGKNGWSYRLIGLDSTNSNAFNREVMLHPSHFVTAQHQDFSEGCAAVPEGAIETMDRTWSSASGAYFYIDGKGAPVRTCAAWSTWTDHVTVSVAWQTPIRACTPEEDTS